MDFEQVYAAELARLRAERKATATSDELIGLAFSGGGIRSATFNLGILQGLAQRGLLKHIDYLSTVSGGGYIGAWYMALLKRLAGGQPAQAEAMLIPGDRLATGDELGAVIWLRRFCNYLAPQAGLSGGTLTIASDFLGVMHLSLNSLLINLVLFSTFLASLLLLPRALAWSVPFFLYYGALPWLAALPLLFAVSTLFPLLFRLRDPGAETPPWWQRQTGIVLLVVIPILVAAFFVALLLASSDYAAWAANVSAQLRVSQHLFWLAGLDHNPNLVVTLFVGAVVYLLPWLVGGIALISRQGRPGIYVLSALTLSALGASLLAGLLFYGLAELAQDTAPTPFEQVVFGLPLVLLACIAPVGLHIGLANRLFTEMQREWWSRLIGWLFTLALIWPSVAAIALFSPVVLPWFDNGWLTAGGGLTWMGSAAWSYLSGKGSDYYGKAGQVRWHAALLRLAPWVFVLGLLFVLSVALDMTLSEHGELPAEVIQTPEVTRLSGQVEGPEAQSYTLSEHTSDQPAPTAERTWRQEAALVQSTVPARRVLHAEFVLLAAFLILGWHIDINLLSFQNYYRNRLTRTFLGASHGKAGVAYSSKGRGRRPDPFTGFDPADDLAVSELDARPYPLFNTALNLVGGDELAWQQRKAASFCIARDFCGYQFPAGLSAGPAVGGYSATRDFMSGALPHGGGISVGTAMTISGVTADSNAGFHPSPAMSFLLTLFNARLGRWVGNPAFIQAWRKTSPEFGVRYPILEFLGLTSIGRAWFNLSDGGHFENLGIYELVRRRLPYIVSVDVTQDADYLFDDLANAIRKIRTDFCIDIEIDLSGLRPRPGDGRQPEHVAIGQIRYDLIDANRRPGVLVYIRPGLTGREPADILSYARQNPPFPYQSTGDQFFDEAQFESYRKLGLYIADSVMREAQERQTTRIGHFNPEAFFTVLREVWRGRLTIDSGASCAHHERLDALYERLRTDPDLDFLSGEFFPEWPALIGYAPGDTTLPVDERQRKSGFYLCREIAQLMEKVYLDLDLESNFEHPDCRGWMNLFRHWSWSSMFRATYSITAATLNERFQRFCQRRLQLDLGAVELIWARIGESSLAELNFVERQLISEELAKTRQVDVAQLELVRFDLVIANPGEAKSALLRFHFGFALLAGTRLLGFRIQDHLRRMGLARRAMTRLQFIRPGLNLVATAGAEAKEQTVLLHLAESVEAILQAAEGSARAGDEATGQKQSQGDA